MPKEKEIHRSSAKAATSSSSKQHESQRVKTEKPVEEKRSSKKPVEEPSHKSSKSSASHEKPGKRSEIVIPDSKKVSFTEESKAESKKSSKHKPAEDSKRKTRDVEIPVHTFDEEERKVRSKSGKAKPVTSEAAGDNYDYEDDFEQEYQDDFEDEFEEADEKPSPSPVQPPKLSPQPEPVAKPILVTEPMTKPAVVHPKKVSPQPEPVSKPASSESYEREKKGKSSEMSYDDEDDNRYSKKDRKQKSSELALPIYDEGKKEKKSTERKAQPSLGLNFKAAIARTSKLSRRANDLLRLVTFDVTRIDFFDIPVVSEYDLYLLNYGKANRKQTATQTFDDAVSKDTQTENVEVTTKWTQNPPRGDDDEHSGSDITKKELSHRKSSGQSSDMSESLLEFMKDASSTIIRLLDDLVNRQSSNQLRKTTGGRKRLETKFGATFGSKVGTFSQANVFTDAENNYVLEKIFFPPHSSLYLITIHAPKDGVVTFGQPHKVVVWDTVAIQSGTKSSPKIVVTSGVRVTCIAMESALTPELLFAGHVDGSLAVWDFRTAFNNNAASFHSSGIVATNAHICAASDTHLAPLKCLLPLPLSSGSSLTESQVGLRCELLSLDESGLLATWAVADLGAANNRTLNDDPAVTPGGRIRLLRSSFGNIASSLSPTDGLLEPTCILIHPTSTSRLLIGMSSGDTLHVARYGGRGGGLGSAHPSVFTRKFVSPVLNLTNFLNEDAFENGASNEIVGAFISATAMGFSIYVTSRSQPVLTFETPNLLHVFPIPSISALSILGLQNSRGMLATVAALTSDAKIQLYPIGPKFSNQWSGASAVVPAPSPSGGAAKGSKDSTTVLSLEMCRDTTAFENDESDSSNRYLSAVAYSCGTVELFQSELVDIGGSNVSDGSSPNLLGVTSSPVPKVASRSSTMSPANQQSSSEITLIDYLLNLV